jgi:hypothetical protein
MVIDTAKAYARRAGRTERSQSRRGICRLRAACVLPIYILLSVSFPLTGSSYFWAGDCARARVTKAVTESDEEWNGIPSSPSKAGGGGQERAAEYSDEEQLATVTVVEDFDPSSLIHGTTTPSPRHQEPPPARSPLPGKASRGIGEVGGGETQGLASKRKNVQVKKVRYETKAARRTAQAKQRKRRTEKAERAGGKAARKKAGGKKRR